MSPSPDEGHLRRHQGHRQNVRGEWQARHVDDRSADFARLDRRLDRDAAIRHGRLNTFVTTQSVLRGDDETGAPHDTTRRSTGPGMNGDGACGGAFGGLREAFDNSMSSAGMS